ncbi:MAG: electron transfer flavoprotein subunit beta/FixA family protein [Victivallales bacterium]|nr:electron transfer flavoprotein subunit beta/FixA family protein [Victivallales bacterium]
MHIIVTVKQVPETRTLRMDEATGTLVRDSGTAIVNPLDLYAVELALQLKELHNAHVTAISMGPPHAEKALREVMSMGVDDAVLVSDRAYAGSDAWSTAWILAAAINTVKDFDLIICGERATDGDTGQVGPELAAALNINALTYVNHFELASAGDFTASRLVEDGEEQLAGKLPMLLTVVKEIAVPRLPVLEGKIRARRAPVKTLGQNELKLDERLVGLQGAPTRVDKIFRPQIMRDCIMASATQGQGALAAVKQLNEFLLTRRIGGGGV